MAATEERGVGRPEHRLARADRPPACSWPPRPDLLAALGREHRDVDALGRWLIDREPDARPATTVRGLLVQMTVHEVCEEVLLDPLVRTRLGPELADRRSAEQRLLLGALDDARDHGLPDARQLQSLLDRFVEHSDREELEVFPPLRHVLTHGELLAGWNRLKLLRARVPRRARQLAASSPQGWRSLTALTVARSLVERTGGAART